MISRPATLSGLQAPVSPPSGRKRHTARDFFYSRPGDKLPVALATIQIDYEICRGEIVDLESHVSDYEIDLGALGTLLWDRVSKKNVAPAELAVEIERAWRNSPDYLCLASSLLEEK